MVRDPRGLDAQGRMQDPQLKVLKVGSSRRELPKTMWNSEFIRSRERRINTR